MLTFSKSLIFRHSLFTILIIGYFNAVLRASPDSGITLFRILIPFILLFSLIFDFKYFYKFYLILFLLLIYGLFNSLIISPWHSFNFVYFLHYATLLLLFFLVKEYSKRVGLHIFYLHLKYFYIFMVLMAYVQLISGMPWPNVQIRDAPNIFFAVENDLSAAIGIFIPYLIVDKSGKKITNWILAFCGYSLIVLAEARIAMISVILFLLLLLWDRHKYVGTLLFILLLIMGIGTLATIDIGGNTLFELFIDPIEHIINLEPYNFGGSITDRADAVIYGITVYIDSWGFGIGPGNTSAKLFQDPRYSLISAESMHNFFAQIVVEYGWLIIVGFFLLLVHIKKIRSSGDFINNNNYKFFLITSILTSLSQSEGLFSNYYFFVCLYFSIYYFNLKESGSSLVHS